MLKDFPSMLILEVLADESAKSWKAKNARCFFFYFQLLPLGGAIFIFYLFS